MEHLLKTISELSIAYANEMIQKNKYHQEVAELTAKVSELETQLQEATKNETD